MLPIVVPNTFVADTIIDPNTVNENFEALASAIDPAISSAAIRYDEAQALTAPQQAQALTNLGAGTNLAITQSITAGNLTQAPSSDAVATAVAGLPISVLNFTTLRAYAGTAKTFYLYSRYSASYAVASDGGGGLFYLDNADVTTPDDDGVVIVVTSGANTGKRIKRFFNGPVFANWWGATGNGVTDDTASVIAMRNYAFARIKVNPAGGDKVSTVSMAFGPGTFLITQSGALIPSTQVTKAQGFHLTGAGLGVTQILFSPAAGDGYLMNNISFLTNDIRDITFTGAQNATGGAPVPQYMRSTSNQPTYAVQNWQHFRVQWGGLWGDIVYLQGNNNNSEWQFIGCAWGGTLSNVINIPAGGSSDQFLNFWFDQCRPWIQSGNFLNMSLGGSIKVTNCDFSGWLSGTIFQLLGASHSFGVQSFLCSGCRFELKAAAVKVMTSQWPGGNITWLNCDWSSQAQAYPATTVAFEYNDANVGGASLTYRDCQIIGLIKFTHGTNDFEIAKEVLFENCDFPQYPDLFRAITFTSSTNDAGSRPLVFRNCRGTNLRLSLITAWVAATVYAVGAQVSNGRSAYICTVGGTSAGAGGPTGHGTGITDNTVTWDYYGNTGRDYYTDCTLWQQGAVMFSRPNALSRRTAMFGSALPRNTDTPNYVELILPPGAVIMKGTVQAAVNAVTSAGPAAYTMTVNDGGTTVVTGTHTPASDGFAYVSAADLYYRCGDNTAAAMPSRAIVLTSNAGVDQQNSKALAFVDIIA